MSASKIHYKICAEDGVLTAANFTVLSEARSAAKAMAIRTSKRVFVYQLFATYKTEIPEVIESLMD